MDHHTTWFSFLPGVAELEAAVRTIQARGLLGTPVVVQHIVAALLTVAVVLSLSWRVRADLKGASGGGVVPSPDLSLRNLVELVAEALLNQMKQVIGPHASRYFPVLFSLTLFIFFGNVLGLIPGFVPPTNNWNTTFACGVFTFLYFNYHGLRVHGFGHISHLANPVGEWWGWFLAPLLFPVELISFFLRPATLGVRLAGNMVADHAVLTAFVGLLPFFLPIPFMLLGLVVCVLQTFVFVLLSMIYLGLATQTEH